ncbi:MAG: redoxin domain-containing protein [Ignavibacteriaceae bacterium]
METELAKNFRLNDQNGLEFQLYENLDKRNLLVFYPSDDTIVCTRQLLNYNDYLPQFELNNIRIVGINTNSIKSHLSFYNKLGLKFRLLSDSNKRVSRDYGALNLLGTNKRKLILIEKDKRIVYKKTVLSTFYLNGEQILKKLKNRRIV